MNTALASLDRMATPINKAGDAVLPLLARLVFAGVLVHYFWKSGVTKLGDGIFGIFNPSLGAYAQIFPKAMEAAGFDTCCGWHSRRICSATLDYYRLTDAPGLSWDDRLYRGPILDRSLRP